LNLAPDQHQQPIFKSILGSCQNIVASLGAVRNKIIGDAHGSRPRAMKPKPRHAELAVNLAGTMASFLVATWQEQQNGLT
jgi:Abortive infection C-terminus